jgi:signal transduction histidine kinase
MRARTRLPRRTLRLRLTALYGSLFLLCGAGLLAITYGLVENASSGAGTPYTVSSGGQLIGQANPTQPDNRPVVIHGMKAQPLTPAQAQAQARLMMEQAASQHAAEMRQLLVNSGIALAVMAFAGTGLGWLVAGRVLRPLRTITATARDITASNLHKRLALPGPDHELKELGDTFDALLARLEAAFTAQSQFIANASHELRTPLARQRVVAQVALAEPDASAESLRLAHERVLAAGAQQERIIDALLTLARGQAGIDRAEPLDLAEIAGQALRARQPEAASRGIKIYQDLRSARTAGDPRLVERLIANLLDNSLRHNIADGNVHVRADAEGGKAVIAISNTGPHVPPTAIDSLLQPFRRLATERTRAQDDGLGIGLSIVAAIAKAHDAALLIEPGADGGLAVEVSFPESCVQFASTSRREGVIGLVTAGGRAGGRRSSYPGLGLRLCAGCRRRRLAGPPCLASRCRAGWSRGRSRRRRR